MSNAEFDKGKPDKGASPLREASDKFRETADRVSSEAGPRVREMMDQASDMAGDFYERASSWLQEGNNRNIGLFALVAAAGLLGFFIGRSSVAGEKISSDLRSY